MKHLILFTFVVFLFASCDKDEDGITPPPAQCDVKGTYAGTATASGSTNASPLVYKLQDNNFAVASIAVGGTATKFGGYRNTCDSIIISSWYTGNENYYLLKGALSDNRTLVSGTFQNLTNTNDFGTFSLTKQ
jgi:hypothetical protein